MLALINSMCVRKGEIYSLHQVILHVSLGRGQALINVCVCVWEGETEFSLILCVCVWERETE